ncbi:uncharacterized protein LOC125499396 [Beta vulgaris subsp. vulgaris]|uniref:uncharacterized protein LOC125499396 n=1 Tax=Beta vulgaris subsp. vulgaris TaxID=3555 RepID=UPI002036EFF9|nr:uncharacterized protein LOC125499396 [Beta vulgaris subsp. vulgaris]
MIKVAYHDSSKTEEVVDYDKMMVIFDPVCLKAAHYRSIGIVVEALQLLDIRIDEDFAMKNTTTTLVNNKGKATSTPSSVGNNIVGHVTPGSVCENGKSPADEGTLMKVVSRSVKDPLKKKRKGSRSVRFRSYVEKGKTKKNQLVLCAGPVGDDNCLESDSDGVHEHFGAEPQLNIWPQSGGQQLWSL